MVYNEKNVTVLTMPRVTVIPSGTKSPFYERKTWARIIHIPSNI